MAFKKKFSPAARAASVMKAISSAEKTAMQAVAGWGKTTGACKRGAWRCYS